MLYIPIWLYSNEMRKAILANATLTLHSNLVIFKCSKELGYSCIICLYIPIWLYSNSLLSHVKAFLFPLYIPIWLYSNNAGNSCSILSNISLHSNLVIFKLIIILLSFFSAPLLYIPIWLYSNINTLFCGSVIFYFTFQSGYIQI